MAKIGIIKESGIEEIVFEEDRPKLIFGLSNANSQRKERRSIGFALRQTGLDVYATGTLWPNDSYVSNNGLAIAERDFEELAHGGNYLFGDGFVLVSTAIKKDLEQKLRDSEHFRDFFAGSEVIFIPPYSKEIGGIGGSKLKLRHIDPTVGYLPNIKRLSIDKRHYHQEEKLLEELRQRYGIDIGVTSPENFFRNNFFVVEHDGSVNVIANSYNNPFKGRKNKVNVIETGEDIVNLPGKFGGSVKCAVNISPTTKLWDALGIEYRRWGVDPRQMGV